MRLRHFVLPLVAVALVAATGCNNKTEEKPGTDSTAAPKAVGIIKGVPGRDDFPNASLAVLAPTPGEVVNADSVMIKVDLKGVDLGSPTAGEMDKGIAYSKQGQHIHVIVDDKPYMAMYKTDSFFVTKLAPGIHTLRAFPSRSWHESVKKPGLFVNQTFYIMKKEGDAPMDMNGPLLTYSRPKGDYSGDDAKRVLLDFYIANLELGKDKFKVVASVDGTVIDTLTEWIPYFIEGLTDGAHKVKLELVGPDGKVVPGVYNSVERTININPPAAAAAAPSPMDTMAGMKHDSGMKTTTGSTADHMKKTPGTSDTDAMKKTPGKTPAGK
ncbi:MAG: hypothetical protein ABIR47_12235 [Candidatus Kapaibacterium sp.]